MSEITPVKLSDVSDALELPEEWECCLEHSMGEIITVTENEARMVGGALTALLILGCGEITLPEVEASATGVIDALDVSASIGRPNILVDHGPNADVGSKMIYAIEDADIAVRSEDGTLRRVEFSDLEIGQKVNIWTTGVRLNSMPGMTTVVAWRPCPIVKNPKRCHGSL